MEPMAALAWSLLLRYKRYIIVQRQFERMTKFLHFLDLLERYTPTKQLRSFPNNLLVKQV